MRSPEHRSPNPEPMGKDDKEKDEDLDDIIESSIIEVGVPPKIPEQTAEDFVDKEIDAIQTPEQPADMKAASVGAEMAPRIQSVFEGASFDRDADLDAIRDEFLDKAKKVAPEMTNEALLDSFRQQIGDIVDGYHNKAAQTEAEADNIEKQGEIKRTMEDLEGADRHMKDAEELRIKAKQILEKGSEIRAYAAQGLERGLENIAKADSAVRDRYLEMVNAEGFEITDEAQKAELLNSFTQEVEAELQERLQSGDISKEKVEALRQNMQGEVQNAVDTKFAAFQEKNSKAAPGEKLEIDEDDMDDILSELG